MRIGRGCCCWCFSSDFFFLLNGNASKFMIKNCWSVATPSMCTDCTMDCGLWPALTQKRGPNNITIKSATHFLKTRMKSMKNASWFNSHRKIATEKRTFGVHTQTHTHFYLSAITIKIESNCNLVRLIKICDTFCSVVIWCEPCSSLFFLRFFLFLFAFEFVWAVSVVVVCRTLRRWKMVFNAIIMVTISVRVHEKLQ